jgi:hypothetical protein
MRHLGRSTCLVVASFALLACEQQVILFEAPNASDGGFASFGDEPIDPITSDGGSMLPLATTDDALGHMMGPVGDAAGPDNGPPDEEDTIDASRGCASDPRVDAYAPGLVKLGAERALRFTLVESRPAPPAMGNNVFTLRVVTSDSASLAGDSKPFRGDLRARLTMPDHEHPPSNPPVITLDTSTDEYTVDSAYFFMAGVWRIEFDAYYHGSPSSGGTPVDSAVYFFCIPPRQTTLGPGGL